MHMNSFAFQPLRQLSNQYLQDLNYKLEEELTAARSLDLRILRKMPYFGDVLVFNHYKCSDLHLNEDYEKIPWMKKIKCSNKV